MFWPGVKRSDEADFHTLLITFCSPALRSFLLGACFSCLIFTQYCGHCRTTLPGKDYLTFRIYIYSPLQLPAVFSREVRGWKTHPWWTRWWMFTFHQPSSGLIFLTLILPVIFLLLLHLKKKKIFKWSICMISAVVILGSFFYHVNKTVVLVHDADSPACSLRCRWVGWWRCCSWPAATAPRWPQGWWCWGVRMLPSWPRRRKASSTAGSRPPWSGPWTVCGTLSSGRPSSWSCPPANANVTLHLYSESTSGRV